MKFVCRSCEEFMRYAEVEVVGEGSLGVTFACPACGQRVSMVTNAGETQMVKALGVQLGGRSEAPQPLELTRANLSSGVPAAPPAAPAPSVAQSIKESMGKCPFSSMVTEMSAKAAERAEGGGAIRWTPEAEDRLSKVPEVVRAFARTMLEDMARQENLPIIDAALMDRAKTRFMGS